MITPREKIPSTGKLPQRRIEPATLWTASPNTTNELFRPSGLSKSMSFNPQLVCGVTPSRSPSGGVMAPFQSLALTLRLWGVTDVRQQRSVHESLRRSSETLMAELMKQEAELTAEERGGHGCQTDLIGRLRERGGGERERERERERGMKNDHKNMTTKSRRIKREKRRKLAERLKTPRYSETYTM